VFIDIKGASTPPCRTPHQISICPKRVRV